jgi:hypothetical protein
LWGAYEVKKKKKRHYWSIFSVAIYAARIKNWDEMKGMLADQVSKTCVDEIYNALLYF